MSANRCDICSKGSLYYFIMGIMALKVMMYSKVALTLYFQFICFHLLTQIILEGKPYYIHIFYVLEDGRSGAFAIGNEHFPASLLDLPCVVESYKTYDDSVLIKTADIGQV